MIGVVGEQHLSRPRDDYEYSRVGKCAILVPVNAQPIVLYTYTKGTSKESPSPKTTNCKYCRVGVIDPFYGG